MQSKNSLVTLPNNHHAKKPGLFFSYNGNFPFKNHDLKAAFFLTVSNSDQQVARIASSYTHTYTHMFSKR